MELGGEVSEVEIQAQRDVFLAQIEYIYAFLELTQISPLSKVAGTLFDLVFADLVRNIGVVESEKIITDLPQKVRLQIAVHITGLTREPYLSST